MEKNQLIAAINKRVPSKLSDHEIASLDRLDPAASHAISTVMDKAGLLSQASAKRKRGNGKDCQTRTHVLILCFMEIVIEEQASV